VKDLTDDVLVPISALEHASYCPRQCALIHLESVWDENVFTLRGSAAHQRADEPTTRQEGGRRIERGLPLWSERYGLIGKADVVEFDSSGTPYPVEYKSGPAREGRHESIQLCAQALCLEEMLGTDVPKGALFWIASRKRVEIALDENLRARTLEIIAATRSILQGTDLPEPANDKRCPKCSLLDACLPGAIVRARLAFDPFAPRPERME